MRDVEPLPSPTIPCCGSSWIAARAAARFATVVSISTIACTIDQDGDDMADKPGRNDPCPCGSGRKFKHCHGPSGASAAAGVRPAARAEVDGLVRLAERHLRSRQFEQAVAPLMKAAQLAPDSASIFADLGVACLATRRFAEAAQCLRRSIALRPGFAPAHHDLGQALEQTGDVDGALAAHRRAAQLQPGLAEAHGRIGDLLTGRGRREEAASAYEQARAASPDTTLGRLCGAKAMTLRDRPREAEAQLKALVARDRTSAEAYLVLGLLLNVAGKFDEAAAASSDRSRSPRGRPPRTTAWSRRASSPRPTGRCSRASWRASRVPRWPRRSG